MVSPFSVGGLLSLSFPSDHSLGLKPTDPEELFALQSKEINNGRLAMIAIAGFVLQEVAEPGVEIFQHLFLDIELDVEKEVEIIENDIVKDIILPLEGIKAK